MTETTNGVANQFKVAGIVDTLGRFDADLAAKGHRLTMPPANEHYTAQGLWDRGIRVLEVPVQPTLRQKIVAAFAAKFGG